MHDDVWCVRGAAVHAWAATAVRSAPPGAKAGPGLSVLSTINSKSSKAHYGHSRIAFSIWEMDRIRVPKRGILHSEIITEARYLV